MGFHDFIFKEIEPGIGVASPDRFNTRSFKLIEDFQCGQQILSGNLLSFTNLPCLISYLAFSILLINFSSCPIL
jgi:hypothetical protein